MLGVAKGIKTDIPGAYLMQELWNVGPSRRLDGGAEAPILWTELVSYAQISETLSEAWELRAIMNMSKAYVTERWVSKDPLCIPPVDRENENG